MGLRLRGAEGTEAETTGGFDLWKANPAITPKLSPIFEKNTNGQQQHFIKMFSVSNLIYYFSEQITERAIHFVFKADL